MLAYLFWHWREAQVEPQTYQEHLILFHQTLSAHKPNGFFSSRVLLLEQAPWIGRREKTYEDWYIVENSGALDLLNGGAVSGSRKEPHHQVAQKADGGMGGLYRFQAGDLNSTAPHVNYWFAKPSGMTYETLYEIFEPIFQQMGGSLWQRHMVLSPAPEFCYQSPHDFQLPDVISSLTVSVTPLWVGPELWYSWRHLLAILADAGYHVVAPDLRGYDETDRPAESEHYTQLHLVGDVIGLMNALGEETAVVAGHDWGATLTWNTALLRPTGCAA